MRTPEDHRAEALAYLCLKLAVMDDIAIFEHVKKSHHLSDCEIKIDQYLQCIKTRKRWFRYWDFVIGQNTAQADILEQRTKKEFRHHWRP